MKPLITTLILFLSASVYSQSMPDRYANEMQDRFAGVGGTQETNAFVSGLVDIANGKILNTVSDYDISLQNAPAVTGYGANLNLTVTGLLTTDVVTVVAGSDKPTIPSNGTLRIPTDSVVYGVTITRSGTVWAVFPFCEGLLQGQAPNKFYDVSGNGHHATIASIAATAITTQDRYFYLMNGYTIGGDIMYTGGDLDYVDSDSVAGWTKGSANFTISEPEEGIVRFKFADNNGTAATRAISLKDVMTQVANTYYVIKYRYRSAGYNNALNAIAQTDATCRIALFSVFESTTHNFFDETNAGGFYLYNTDGEWREETSYILAKSAAYLGGDVCLSFATFGNTANSYVDIDYVRMYKCQLVPKLLSSNLSASGVALDVVQDGKSLLKFAADIQFDTSLSVNNKYKYSWIQENGKAKATKKYLSKTTNTIFTAAGTELLTPSNKVREVLDSNQFFTGSVANVVSFANINSWYPEFAYFSKKDRYTIDKITMLKSTQKESTASLKSTHTLDTVNRKLLVIMQDHFTLLDSFYTYVKPIFDKYNYHSTIAVNYTGGSNLDSLAALKAEGYDLILHTPQTSYLAQVGYKDFADYLSNYTQAELDNYYSKCITLYDGLGYNSRFKVFPGGTWDSMTVKVVKKYFDAGFTTAPNYFRYSPHYKQNYGRESDKYWAHLPRLTVQDAKYDTWVTMLTNAAAADGMLVCYYHLDTNWTTKYNDTGGVDAGGEVLAKKIDDFIAYALSQGWYLVTLDDMFDIISQTK